MLRNCLIIGLGALALAACGDDAAAPVETAAPTAAPGSAPATSAALTLDGEGLRAGSPAQLIAFGAPAADVVAAVGAAMGGEPTRTANPDCPTGATEDYAWGAKLAVITRDGAFIGWHSSEAGPTTSSGVHALSPRTAATASDSFETVESQFEQTQISVDGVSGFLTDDGETVGVLYSGDTCIAG